MGEAPRRAPLAFTGEEEAGARLRALQRAYDDLAERVRLYEKERLEIRLRVEHLLRRLAQG